MRSRMLLRALAGAALAIVAMSPARAVEVAIEIGGLQVRGPVDLLSFPPEASLGARVNGPAGSQNFSDDVPFTESVRLDAGIDGASASTVFSAGNLRKRGQGPTLSLLASATGAGNSAVAEGYLDVFGRSFGPEVFLVGFMASIDPRSVAPGETVKAWVELTAGGPDGQIYLEQGIYWEIDASGQVQRSQSISRPLGGPVYAFMADVVIDAHVEVTGAASISLVPEPATAWLWATGAVLLGGLRRRRR